MKIRMTIVTVSGKELLLEADVESRLFTEEHDLDGYKVAGDTKLLEYSDYRVIYNGKVVARGSLECSIFAAREARSRRPTNLPESSRMNLPQKSLDGSPIAKMNGDSENSSARSATARTLRKERTSTSFSKRACSIEENRGSENVRHSTEPDGNPTREQKLPGIFQKNM